MRHAPSAPRLAARFLRRLVLGSTFLTTLLVGRLVEADEPQWIWSPAYEKELAPQGDCYFRKSFTLGTPEQGEIQISCDDRYELYVNGRLIGSGKNWKVMDVYDITKDLVQGNNTVAVKAANGEGGSAGLVARVVVKAQGGTHVTQSTDGTWKTALKEFVGWQRSRFNDSQWLAARTFGKVNATLPWGNEVTVAGAQGRFKVIPKFKVEWVVEPQDTGSLIAMTFDEFGQIIAARENGSLLIIKDEDKNGLLETVSTFSDEIKGCQGLLSVSGRLFVTGQGPDGAALYRLADQDRDGQADEIKPILKFSGEMGEHGPHSLVLGPDGLIYVVVGNFSHVEKKYEPTSPYHHFYEGDLLQPRYEDASGHAVGIQAPGGSILRTDSSGSAVELVAGGLQNPYDIAFNADGELFTADSDMEWDLGTSWYRSTRVNHVAPGGEFGWRSGWAKWPEYYLDSLPPLVEMGRGSPTGLEVYSHHNYPQRFHNALFVCDWSRGRILAVKMKPNGGTYKASTEVFLEGQPLNVTDCAVGPDGWLYFCTGGRDTEGGIFRVVWEGEVPPELREQGKGLTAALKQPQLNSAWARQKVAVVKQQMGPKWDTELVALVENVKAPIAERVRALDLLQLFGPHPTTAMLIKVSQEKKPALRAKAAGLMGLHADEKTVARLGEMVADSDLLVSRRACESLARTAQQAPVAKLLPLLASSDRHVAWAARRALERVDRKRWQKVVIDSDNVRTFLNGSVSLLSMYPDEQSVDAVLNRSSEWLGGYLSDPDFLDVLRVMQLAVSFGKLEGTNVPELRRQLADEYPSKEPRMNRELVKLLVYLQEPSTAARVVQVLESDEPPVERVHAALCARFLTTGWNTDRKLAMLKFYEEARTMSGGHSYVGYIDNVSRDFFAGLNEEERQLVLASGAKWPTSALLVLSTLPETISPETLDEVQQLDRQLKRVDGDPARKLRLGIAAVLAASGQPSSMAYLREIWQNEPDRRVPIAMALAQQPDGENWPLLVRSLSIVEGAAAQEILVKLTEVDQAPEEAEPYRQVIIRGLMLRENGGRQAAALLEKWTGRHLTEPDASWAQAMTRWQKWFVETYPDLPEPALPQESPQSNWAYQELLSYLTSSSQPPGNGPRGALVFEKANCAKCHRHGDRGEAVGPDLTTLSKRFQRKEILESVLFPSQVISDQYATQSITTTDGRSLSGMVSPRGDGSMVVLQSNGEKVVVAKIDIEQSVRSKHSSMPEGLLNALTLEEVGDLFAFLTQGSGSVEAARKPGRPSR